MDALVYINYGQVVVDCPNESCYSAFRVDSPDQQTMFCDPNPRIGGCGITFNLVIAGNIGEIFQELSRRPFPANRNWFPEGHPIAIQANYPMDQTVADLAAEFELAREGNEV